MKKSKTLDLFSGAGDFSLGVIQDGSFDIEASMFN